jgi:hypothetical protein
MGDAWEEGYGLDPRYDDSAEDPDGDGFSNLDEYLLGTNPVESAEDGDGCEGGCKGSDDGASLILLLPLLWRRRERAGV